MILVARDSNRWQHLFDYLEDDFVCETNFEILWQKLKYVHDIDLQRAGSWSPEIVNRTMQWISIDLLFANPGMNHFKTEPPFSC